MIGPVVRIDLLQRTLVAILGTELGIPIIFGKSNLPRPPRPYGRLDLTSGPSRRTISHDRVTKTTNSDYLLDVPAAPIDGDVVLMRVNGVPLRHAITAVETQTSLRDALIVLVGGDREPATASIESATQLRVTEAEPGSLVFLEATIPVSVAPDSTTACIELLHAVHECTLDFEIYGADNKVGTDGAAADLMGKVQLILDLRRTLAALDDQRFTVNTITEPTDLGDLEGGGAVFESRYTIGLGADITSMYAEVIDVIDTAEGIIDISGTQVPFDTAS